MKDPQPPEGIESRGWAQTAHYSMSHRGLTQGAVFGAALGEMMPGSVAGINHVCDNSFLGGRLRQLQSLHQFGHEQCDRILRCKHTSEPWLQPLHQGHDFLHCGLTN